MKQLFFLAFLVTLLACNSEASVVADYEKKPFFLLKKNSLVLSKAISKLPCSCSSTSDKKTVSKLNKTKRVKPTVGKFAYKGQLSKGQENMVILDTGTEVRYYKSSAIEWDVLLPVNQ